MLEQIKEASELNISGWRIGGKEKEALHSLRGPMEVSHNHASSQRAATYHLASDERPVWPICSANKDSNRFAYMPEG